MNSTNFKIFGFYTDPILFLSFILLPVVIAILCLYQCFRLLKRARSIEDNPISKIRSAAQGYVELEGKVYPITNQPVIGYSQKPCVWYRYTIAEFKTYRLENETQQKWEIIAKGTSQQNFLLNDGTGECVVMPKGAEIITHNTLIWYGHSINPPPFPAPSFWRLFFGPSGNFCYKEERLEIAQPVYATGMFFTQEKVNILNNEDLGQKQSLLISAFPERKVAREYRIRALIFFLGFLFFFIMTVNSGFPIVIKSLEDWSKKQ